MIRPFQFFCLAVIGLLAGAATIQAAPLRIELTDTERAWIRAHPVVYFGYDPGWGPFSYRDEKGGFAGIDRDFLMLLEKRLGLKFEPVHARSWPEAYEAAKAGSVDFLVSTAEDEERSKYFIFTRPYNSFPMAFVARKDAVAIVSMEQLRGQKIAISNGYVGALTLERDFPAIGRLVVPTMEDAFLAVSVGRADVTATNIANANYIIESLGLTNLKIAGLMPYLFELRYAVREDQVILRDILDKGIASFSTKDRQDIVAPWVKVQYENIIRWDYVMRWVLGASVVVGLFIAVMIYHNRRLRRELRERLRIQSELEATRVRLEQLNEEKSGLLRMAAHDLRNPLNGLMLNVEILRESARPSDRESLDVMLMLVHQMIHMIRNILDVQALEDGRRNLRNEPLDITKEIRQALDGMQPEAARKRITLRAQFALAVPPVLADQGALRQVINNLVSNALKYSPFDREVIVEAEPTLIGRVALRVRDRGPGVRPEDMPRLFQKYSRLGARPTGGEQSTGLGLAIVRQLVTVMGGTVRCESTSPDGSVFIVELPAAVKVGGEHAGMPADHGVGI